MKLNKEQIIDIRNFVSDQGIRYYDVQLEIIDHVACKAEDLMTVDPNLTLDEVITQTHADFGVSGFVVVEDAMRKSLRKRYWRLFGTIFLSYLKPVYLLLEMGFIYLIYLLAKNTHSVDLSIDITWIMVILITVIFGFNNNIRLRKKYKHRMLAMKISFIVTSIINLPVQLFIWFFLLGGRTPYLFGAVPTAIICGVLLTLIIIISLTLKQIEKQVINNCRELEGQYQITIGS